MNYLYLLINFLVILFPFLFSFEKKASFYKKWPAFGMSFLLVGVPFIIWDILMTKYDHWGFNPDHVLGYSVLSIPIEEALFFFTVPYACLFTYEAIDYYMPRIAVPYNKIPYIVAGVVISLLAVPFRDQTYTASVLVALGVVLVLSIFIYPGMFSMGSYWVYIFITLGLFILVNYFLTSIPIVWYRADSIWGGDGAWNGRFITIPYEDFLYNVAMLTGYLAIYLRFRDTFSASAADKT
jgi:lycopene cyclase domain-containing protein